MELMNNYIIKNELSSVNIPYLDTSFGTLETILKTHHFKSETITLIAEYAEISEKVDTIKMIDIFLKGCGDFPSLSSDFIEKTKKQFPDCVTCLDSSTTTTPIKSFVGESNERKLMIIARLYFKHKIDRDWEAHKLIVPKARSDAFQSIVDQNEYESKEFINKITGIQILYRGNYKKDKLVCHTYVFGHEKWYKEEINNFFNSPDKIIKLLQGKKYTLQATPEPGFIAVYFRLNEVTHYGIVDSVDSDGNVTLISKFGENNLHRHRTELVPYIYGTQLLYFAPPQNQ